MYHVGSSSSLDKVTGVHLPGKNNDDVETLNIYEQNLTFVPKNIDKFFKNLKLLAWFNSNLVQLSAVDLRPFPQLLVLSIRFNNLPSLDADLLKYNLKLRFVSFMSNRIRNVGRDLVTHLEELEWLDFALNTCTNRQARTRSEVISLSKLLPELCPPLNDYDPEIPDKKFINSRLIF